MNEPDGARKRVAILGGGVHAVVVADCIRAEARGELVGYFDRPGHNATHMSRMNVPWLGVDDRIACCPVDSAILGMAGIEHGNLRREIVNRVGGGKTCWFTTIHPRATVAGRVEIGEGAVIFAGALVNPLARIGAHAVINTAAVIEHHAVIEDFAVISPNATICGCVHVGESAFIGAGAVVVTGVSIGAQCIVGAGAVVLRDVPAGAVVVGNPARALDRVRRPALEDLAALSS